MIIITTIIMTQLTQFIVVTAPVMMLTIAACVYTRRFTRIEYEYVILAGEFNVTIVYDSRARKDLIKGAKISEMHKIVPYHTNEKLLEAPDINKVLYYCSDLEHPDLYLVIYDDKSKGKTGVVFNSSRKFAQTMKFYNSLNTIVKNDFAL